MSMNKDAQVFALFRQLNIGQRFEWNGFSYIKIDDKQARRHDRNAANVVFIVYEMQIVKVIE